MSEVQERTRVVLVTDELKRAMVEIGKDLNQVFGVENEIGVYLKETVLEQIDSHGKLKDLGTFKEISSTEAQAYARAHHASPMCLGVGKNPVYLRFVRS